MVWIFFAGIRREKGGSDLERVSFFSESLKESVATVVSTPPSEEKRTLASSGRTTEGDADCTTDDMRDCRSSVLIVIDTVGFSGRGMDGKSS